MSNSYYALITGGSRGIGKALATQLAAKGYHLLLVSGTDSILQQTAKELKLLYPSIDIQYLSIDLSLPEAAKAVFDWTNPYHDKLQLLVNNAGLGISGAFSVKPIETQLKVIDVNFRTLVALSYLFIPILQKQKKAYILNIASTAAYQSVPYLSVYAASKAAVLSFSRGLKQELSRSSISVSCVSPGSTDTYFADRAEMGPSIKKIAARFNMSPEKVAAIAINGLFKHKAEIIPGNTNKLNAFIPRLFPKSWVEKIAGNIYKT